MQTSTPVSAPVAKPRARSNAEKTLRLLFKRLGWDVEIAWQGVGEVASR